ncbi:MAG: hypothetical protein AAGD06_21245 [Acidobacteriota bacterium]
MAGLLPLLVMGSAPQARAADGYPSEIAVQVSESPECKTTNIPFQPLSDLYVDSGRTFVLNGKTGTTCWNRLDNDGSATPSSFAGADGRWFLLSGADCPAEDQQVMREWPMTSGNPIQDVSCVTQPPLLVTCTTSNHPFSPGTRTYVDSGRPVIIDGKEGTTCWNRLDNDTSATPSSFAGWGDEWLLFAGADCPPHNDAVVFSEAKRSDDPTRDLGCVELPPVPAPDLKLTCEGSSMHYDSKGTYVDSGLRFSPGGDAGGTTCWNRLAGDAGAKATSFAGYGNEWLIFSGADCPANSSAVIYSWPKASDDPVADVPCVDH